MSAAILPAPRLPTSNPFEIAKRDLVEQFNKLTTPVPLPVSFADPVCFDEVNGHIKEAVAIFDRWLASVGGEVASHAPWGVKVNTDLFNDVISEAVVGWATEEVARCSVVAQAELEEIADSRASRGRW